MTVDRETLEHNREIGRKFIMDWWGKAELGLGRSLFHDDFVDHQVEPGQSEASIEGINELIREFHSGLAEMETELHFVHAFDDIVVDHWTISGIHKGTLMGRSPTGNRIAFSGIDVLRISDGKIAEMWHVEELAQLFSQLDPSLEISFG